MSNLTQSSSKRNGDWFGTAQPDARCGTKQGCVGTVLACEAVELDNNSRGK